VCQAKYISGGKGAQHEQLRILGYNFLFARTYTYIHTYIHIYTDMYVNVYTYIYIYLCAHTCIYIYIPTCMYMYIYIYIYIDVHVVCPYIHIYVYIHIYKFIFIYICMRVCLLPNKFQAAATMVHGMGKCGYLDVAMLVKILCVSHTHMILDVCLCSLLLHFKPVSLLRLGVCISALLLQCVSAWQGQTHIRHSWSRLCLGVNIYSLGLCIYSLGVCVSAASERSGQTDIQVRYTTIQVICFLWVHKIKHKSHNFFFFQGHMSRVVCVSDVSELLIAFEFNLFFQVHLSRALCVSDESVWLWWVCVSPMRLHGSVHPFLLF